MKVREGCTNPACCVAMATELCTVVPNMFGSAVWNFLHVILLGPRIVWCTLDLWKVCAFLK